MKLTEKLCSLINLYFFKAEWWITALGRKESYISSEASTLLAQKKKSPVTLWTDLHHTPWGGALIFLHFIIDCQVTIRLVWKIVNHLGDIKLAVLKCMTGNFKQLYRNNNTWNLYKNHITHLFQESYRRVLPFNSLEKIISYRERIIYVRI